MELEEHGGLSHVDLLILVGHSCSFSLLLWLGACRLSFWIPCVSCDRCVLLTLSHCCQMLSSEGTTRRRWRVSSFIRCSGGQQGCSFLPRRLWCARSRSCKLLAAQGGFLSRQPWQHMDVKTSVNRVKPYTLSILIHFEFCARHTARTRTICTCSDCMFRFRTDISKTPPVYISILYIVYGVLAWCVHLLFTLCIR